MGGEGHLRTQHMAKLLQRLEDPGDVPRATLSPPSVWTGREGWEPTPDLENFNKENQ